MKVNLHRDLLSLTNRYTSAWDTWRSATTETKQLSQSDVALGDQLATLMAQQRPDGFSGLGELAALMQVPPWIDSHSV